MWDKLSQEYLACGVVGRGMIKFPIVICMDFALLWSFSVVSCVTFDIFIGLVSLVWSGYFYISTVERIRWILLLIKVVSFSCGNIIYIRCGMYSRIILSMRSYSNAPNQQAYASFYLIFSAPLASSPVWARDFSSSEELITEFCRECRVVRKGNQVLHNVDSSIYWSCM